uniref:Uncharacterized protein n=1 Tax=Lutzomyia longipalpis TaxID=7200 RepID=A0A7G3B2J5_LUTLO
MCGNFFSCCSELLWGNSILQPNCAATWTFALRFHLPLGLVLTVVGFKGTDVAECLGLLGTLFGTSTDGGVVVATGF